MVDRATVYTQEQGRSVDFLFAQRSTMIGLGKMAQAALGSNTVVRGLAVTPNSPAALNVLVGLGEIYSVQQVDATPWGSLTADTTDTIVKQGLNMAAQTISTPAPGTSGFSVNYLIEAQYQDQDTNSAVLPYYNSANPQLPLNGQGGNGAPQATQRQGLCVIQAKAGIAAATGTQTTPSVDAGWTALAVVTVANGASTVTSGNISIPAGVPQVTCLLQMMQTGSPTYAIDTSSTPNQIAIALTPPIASYTDGQPLNFQAANNNTGPCTINAGPGSIALNGASGAFQGGEIVAGKFYEAVYRANTGTVVVIGQSGGALQIAPATQPLHAVQLGQIPGTYALRGLNGANNATTPATKFDFTAVQIALRNPTTGLVFTTSGVSTITNDITVAGSTANGRDQAGAFTTNSWVYFYYIWNGTTLATLSSASQPATGPTLPSGYTHWAYIGTVWWSGATLALGSFRGAWFNYNSGQNAVVGGTSTTLVAVSVSTIVPTSVVASQFELLIQNLALTSNGSGAYALQEQIVISGSAICMSLGLQGSGTASTVTGVSGPTKRVNNIGQNFAYQLIVTTGAGPTTTIWVTGYSNANGDS